MCSFDYEKAVKFYDAHFTEKMTESQNASSLLGSDRGN
jgi:hypothetical protein